MSTDVNATVGRGFVNWAKGYVKTFVNRLMRSRKVEEAVKKVIEEKGLDTGWFIGPFGRGRYHNPKTGEDFDEKSFSIMVRGAPLDMLKDMGRELARKFDQDSVLLVDNASGGGKFIYA
jgi:hypothetical protein